MNFFEKLGKVLLANVTYTVVLVFGLALFLYFSDGDLVAGFFTALFALIIYVCISLLYQEYKKLPKTDSKPVVKKVAKKATVKKSVKRKK